MLHFIFDDLFDFLAISFFGSVHLLFVFCFCFYYFFFSFFFFIHFFFCSFFLNLFLFIFYQAFVFLSLIKLHVIFDDLFDFLAISFVGSDHLLFVFWFCFYHSYVLDLFFSIVFWFCF